ncbi:hypothetical protein BV25DRAFT_842190 [Artomyces pyxidatus]|uniref:Uncharacterized protein n=1 Tax=Artomyces pyxidatus TaxID=48021 RepID=A0ACB8TGU2_9AGAM|nr:hypothetical protein BV25DRAFT_842190 [Artomyces pyxidatus]
MCAACVPTMPAVRLRRAATLLQGSRADVRQEPTGTPPVSACVLRAFALTIRADPAGRVEKLSVRESSVSTSDYRARMHPRPVCPSRPDPHVFPNYHSTALLIRSALPFPPGRSRRVATPPSDPAEPCSRLLS